MAAEQRSSTLFAKLARISGELGRVAKNGRNDHHGYDYVTETDLVEAVRAKLAAAGVAYFFSVESFYTREVESVLQNKDTKGWDRIPAKAGAVTEVIVKVTFADGESGETFSVQGAGAGQDAGDKGLYKALTGAQKYVLMKTFLIATGDDPEGDVKVDKANDEQPKPAAKTKPAEPVKKAEPKKTQAQEHGPAKGEDEDPMMKVLPGGPYKGKTVGSLSLEQATELLEGIEGKLQPMPKSNSWTALVQLRYDYLKKFEEMPEPLKEVAKDLDLDIPAA